MSGRVKQLAGEEEAKNMQKQALRLKRRQTKYKVVRTHQRCKVNDAEGVRAPRVWLEGNVEEAVEGGRR